MQAWWLLDENRKMTASVRAKTAEDARKIFQAHGLTGRWIHRVTDSDR